MLKRRLQAGPGPRPGFTLVEILIAAVVMVLSTIGSTLLFNQATRQGLSGNLRLQDQLAISRDLAAIFEVNERYNCDLSGCAVSLGPVVPGTELEALPDQDAYAPADVDASLGGGSSFRALCQRGLLMPLLSALETTGDIRRDASTGAITLVGTGVQRSVSLLDATGSGTTLQSVAPHRYRIDWRDGDGRLLRQVQLVPTVAAWCP